MTAMLINSGQLRNRHSLGRKKSARRSISENSPAIDVSRRVPFDHCLDRVEIEKNKVIESYRDCRSLLFGL